MQLFSQEMRPPVALDSLTMLPLEQYEAQRLQSVIQQSWSVIAPAWPLKNIIAVNPLMGLIDLPFENALEQAEHWFQQAECPAEIQAINRIHIKWLMAFYDQGQASIPMPMRHLGLLSSCRQLLQYDRQIVRAGSWQERWLQALPQDALSIIYICLNQLAISQSEQPVFLTRMLTTLPGWAAYTQYRCEWPDAADAAGEYTVTQTDYLALRLILTCLIWPAAKDLLKWHQHAIQQQAGKAIRQQRLSHMQDEERAYQDTLLTALTAQMRDPHQADNSKPDAQLVFCIDVRSEPFRRALESTGNYQTLGFAGFFGLPIALHHQVHDEQYASCPVLVKPAHQVIQSPCAHADHHHQAHQRLVGLRGLFQSLKYTFAAPFNLVETLGPVTGLWMGIKSLFPATSAQLKHEMHQRISPSHEEKLDYSDMDAASQQQYAENALRMMGLTQDFAPLVVLCGHGSTTQNNAFASALDCGACGGRHGGSNARVLASLLNQTAVRQALTKRGIVIPSETVFIGAEHNTTTDEVDLYGEDLPPEQSVDMRQLQLDLATARDNNSAWRLVRLQPKKILLNAANKTKLRAIDWAQTRPEWGLSGNASMIIAPRWLSKHIDLKGRAFLHSYDYQQDTDCLSLTTILTAPMVVAHWINAQYLFSTYDNVAFGAGSKVSSNIVGKIGIMQGNASDLMHGLPLQSLYHDDLNAYHGCMRLTVVVYAQREQIMQVIQQQTLLQQLFSNGWVHLFCLDPSMNQSYALSQELQWTPLN